MKLVTKKLLGLVCTSSIFFSFPVYSGFSVSSIGEESSLTGQDGNTQLPPTLTPPTPPALVTNVVTITPASGTVDSPLNVVIDGDNVVGATYSTSSPNCSVTSSGEVSASTPGTCSVTVNIPADQTYLAFSGAADFTFTPALVANPVSLAGASGTVGDALNVQLTGGNSAGATYSTSSSNCSVTSSGEVSASTPGTCRVTVNIPADQTYLAFSGAADFTFTPALVANPVSLAGASGTVGDALNVQLTGGNSAGATYSTSSPNCSVSTSGVVTATSASTCSVTVNIPANETYLAFNGNADYIFSAAFSFDTCIDPLDSASPSQMRSYCASNGGVLATLDEFTTRTVAGRFTDSRNRTGCDVSGRWTVFDMYPHIVQASGTLNWQRSYGDGTYYNAVGGGSYGDQTITNPWFVCIEQIANTISVNGANGTVGDTLQIAVSGTSLDGMTLSTETQGCSIAFGAVTASSPGTCSVSVDVPAHSFYQSYSTTVDFVFDPRPLIANPISIQGGSGVVGTPLQVSLSGGSAVGVTYSTSSANCSVTTAGAVSATSAGTCSIQVSIPADATYLAYSGTADYVFTAPRTVELVRGAWNGGSGTTCADGFTLASSTDVMSGGSFDTAIGDLVNAHSTTSWGSWRLGSSFASSNALSFYMSDRKYSIGTSYDSNTAFSDQPFVTSTNSAGIVDSENLGSPVIGGFDYSVCVQ